MGIWIQTGANFGNLDAGAKKYSQVQMDENTMEMQQENYMLNREQEENPSATDENMAERMLNIKSSLQPLLDQGYLIDEIIQAVQTMI